MKATYKTKEEAKQAAIKEHGALAVEMEVINVVFIGPTIAKFLGVEVGYSFS